MCVDVYNKKRKIFIVSQPKHFNCLKNKLSGRNSSNALILGST